MDSDKSLEVTGMIYLKITPHKLQEGTTDDVQLGLSDSYLDQQILMKLTPTSYSLASAHAV
jgi:hypothetical protein